MPRAGTKLLLLPHLAAVNDCPAVSHAMTYTLRHFDTGDTLIRESDQHTVFHIRRIGIVEVAFTFLSLTSSIAFASVLSSITTKMSMEQPEGLQAIVFGASGVTGYPLLKNLLSYPTPTSFSRVIGLTNRQLSKEVAHLPEDGRIELFSGLDLTNREQVLFQLQHIPGIQGVTHAYYAAYAGHGSDYQELKRINCEILTNAIGSLEICCPALQFVTLQTGGKVRLCLHHASRTLLMRTHRHMA